MTFQSFFLFLLEKYKLTQNIQMILKKTLIFAFLTKSRYTFSEVDMIVTACNFTK